MILEIVPVGAYQANCYVIAAARDSGAIIVDPGQEEKKIKRVLERYHLKAAFVVNTHGHFDHIGADAAFGVPVYVHRLDAEMLKSPELNFSGFIGADCRVTSEIRPVEDGDIIRTDGVQLKVLHTPGHSPGGISLLMLEPAENIVFTGDTLFYHGVGRTDFAGGSEERLMQSIKEKLFALPATTMVHPGHGPSSTIGEEKKNNPYII